MTTIRQVFKPAMYSLVMAAVLAGCGGGSALDAQSTRLSVNSPDVASVSPADLASGVATRTNNGHDLVSGTVVTVTFNQVMTQATISLAAGTAAVLGTSVLSADGRSATFTPTAALNPNTVYTATLGDTPANLQTWSFTTDKDGFTAHQPVALGSTATFAILTKTGVTDVYASAITGDVGASPISGAAIGLTCGEMVGNSTIYSVDAAGPLPCVRTDATKLTTAVGDMELAYTDAAGRTLPDFNELGAGEIGGLTLKPGLYKWGTDVLISTDVTLNGGANDIFIFQIAGEVKQASATQIILTGGAQAKNVYWQAAGAVSVGTTAKFKGVVLAKTLIAVKTGASVDGRLLAQTAVTLEKNVVTQPSN